jgi:hypothetical protein
MVDKLSKKLLYLSGDKSIAYDKERCYRDGMPCSNDEDAILMTKTRVSDELEKLLGNITNVAVLTAAGTSLDNYENSGKTELDYGNIVRQRLTLLQKS